MRANATAGSFAGVLRNVGLRIGVGILVGALVLRDPPDDRLADIDADANEDTDSELEDAGFGRGKYVETPRSAVRLIRDRTDLAAPGAVRDVRRDFGSGPHARGEPGPVRRNVGLSAVIATVDATLLPIADGVGRLSVGGPSDRFGRERSMGVAFGLCGVGLFALTGAGTIGTAAGFVGSVALASLFEGTQYSVMASTVGATTARSTRSPIARRNGADIATRRGFG